MKKFVISVFTLLIVTAAALFVVTQVSADNRKTAAADLALAESEAAEPEIVTEAVTEAPAAEETIPETTPEMTTTVEITTAETTTETEPETTETEAWPVAFQQSDPRWCDIPYGYGNWSGTRRDLRQRLQLCLEGGILQVRGQGL